MLLVLMIIISGYGIGDVQLAQLVNPVHGWVKELASEISPKIVDYDY